MKKQYTLKGEVHTAGELAEIFSNIAREAPDACVKIVTTFGGFVKEVRVEVDVPIRNRPELS
jgi:hypothetical protein